MANVGLNVFDFGTAGNDIADAAIQSAIDACTGVDAM